MKSPGVDSDPLWYKDAVIYEVRTRSFFDSNGDGIGDLAGLASKLDYLADLGITALWILPHYPSPGRDDGYDIADYHDIHPDIGTLEDFDLLIKEAHKRGIRIITELVMNHTSDSHPWFQRARRAPAGSPERDFYVWNETADKYRDARIIFRDFEPSNWSWDPVAKAYYWHRFFAHQPDLNFENPAVHEAMFGVVDFWLGRGVDGLRLDAVPYLYEEEGTNCENLPKTHAFLKKLRAHVDAKFPGKMLLAEANQWPEDAAAYFGEGDECHMNFHFPIMPRLFMSIHMEDRFPIIDILKQTPELHPTCQWGMFLRNHDELTLEMVTDEERDYMYRAYAHEAQMRINLGIRRRLAPLVGNDRRKMELLNGLLFSMPGTPVMYYGDEIGMGDNVYLGDRNGVRTPMQWSSDRNAGFSRANPQRLILPIIIDPEYHYEALNVEMQQSSSTSLLWWTKRLVALRKNFQAFGRGTVEFLHPSNPRVLAFIRRYESETILVVANLSRHTQFVELDLASCKGLVPVELMGRTRFPTVDDNFYRLSLGGHDFYWFSLEAARTTAAQQDERVSLHGVATLIPSSIDALLFGSERDSLEALLPELFTNHRWVSSTPSRVSIVRAMRFDDAAHLVVKVEYEDGDPESFALPVAVRETASSPGNVIAAIHIPETPPAVLEISGEGVSKAFMQMMVKNESVRESDGSRIVGGTLAPVDLADGPIRVLSNDRLAVTVSFSDQYVVKLFYRMEEGTAPELEVARVLQSKGVKMPVPKTIGFVEHRAHRAEPVTLAIAEEFVQHEASAWQHARSEVGRAYDRVLARPKEDAAPNVPSQPLSELAYLDPPEAHIELVGSYRDHAKTLGQRVAELHLALASSTDPAFEPNTYSSMDQRSRYQSARNLVGRVIATLRRSFGELDALARPLAELVAAHETDLLARFEPLLGHRIDAKQIRIHGDLHLGRALFTGKDFVIVGLGGARDERLSERRRKNGAMRDVAAVIRSYHYAAAETLRTLRPEDQERAETWGWIWQRWVSAAFLRGYLDVAGNAPFVSQSAAMRSVLLETSVIEKAFSEVREELRTRPDRAWIPLQGIVRLLGLTPKPTSPT